MSCANCLNLKIQNFTYQELVAKWDEIYHPEAITGGYETRMRREAVSRGIPFDWIKVRHIYCSKGILSRFYIIRTWGLVKAKPAVVNCKYYC